MWSYPHINTINYTLTFTNFGLDNGSISILLLSKIILFGSYAKGTAKPDSDIDIAVISSQFGKDSLKEMIFLRKLAIRVDSHIEPLSFPPKDLKDRYSTLTSEINKFGIII